jgi:hypothetical protein
LNASRASLNATEAEVEAARVAADGAEAHRVGMCLRMIFVLRLTSGELWFPLFLPPYRYGGQDAGASAGDKGPMALEV